jgi:hypothetical protein
MAAAIARYPHVEYLAPDSWAYKWADGKFTGFGADEDSLNAIAQALADLEAATEARVRSQVADWLYAEFGDDLEEAADDIRAGRYVGLSPPPPEAKEQP